MTADWQQYDSAATRGSPPPTLRNTESTQGVERVTKVNLPCVSVRLRAVSERVSERVNCKSQRSRLRLPASRTG